VRSRLLTAIAAVAIGAAAATPAAAEVLIVALGASNTYGSGNSHRGGVPSSQAFPAKLQALLRARGLDARVRNAGVPGDTTAGMLARLNSAVPNGTAVVILQPGGNDARHGKASAVSEIRRRLAARHIKVIMLERPGAIAPKGTRDPDGQHFNARGHAAIAAYLAPKVMAAVRGN
jgi:acyl-CoA thioesterase I